MFWVISIYFNIRNTLPKSGTFLLGHPVYIYISKNCYNYSAVVGTYMVFFDIKLFYFILFYFYEDLPLKYILNLSCTAFITVFVDLQKKAITKHSFHTADKFLLHIIYCLNFPALLLYISFP